MKRYRIKQLYEEEKLGWKIRQKDQTREDPRIIRGQVRRMRQEVDSRG